MSGISNNVYDTIDLFYTNVKQKKARTEIYNILRLDGEFMILLNIQKIFFPQHIILSIMQLQFSCDFMIPRHQLCGTPYQTLCIWNALDRKGQANELIGKTRLLHYAPLTHLVESRGKSYWEIQKVSTAVLVNASEATTHKCIQDLDFNCHIPLAEPLLRKKQRQQCFTWLMQERDGPVAPLVQGLFLSDENEVCNLFWKS